MWIEDSTDAIHDVQIVIRKDVANVFSLFQADAMFTRHRAAGIRTQLQDLITDSKHGLVLAGLEGVEEHQGMQVAVAGMKDVADLETGPLGDAGDGLS